MDDQQAWARQRLLELAERLTPEGLRITELRSSGISPSRIFVLYPFVYGEWADGILDLTHDAEWLPAPSEPTRRQMCELEVMYLLGRSWEYISSLAGQLDKQWRTREMAEAWSRATNDENPSMNADVLSYTVLLLDALANDRAHPAQSNFAKMLWESSMEGGKQVVDELVRLLQEGNWECTPLRGQENKL